MNNPDTRNTRLLQAGDGVYIQHAAERLPVHFGKTKFLCDPEFHLVHGVAVVGFVVYAFVERAEHRRYGIIPRCGGAYRQPRDEIFIQRSR